MDPKTRAAYLDEMEKIAIDPATLGAMGMGKYFLSNALQMYGHKIPAIRRVGQEVVGASMRAGMAGKPALSPVTQGALGVFADPHLVKMYQASHAAGSALRGIVSPQRASQSLKDLATSGPVSRLVGKDATKFIEGVPLTADTRLRKAIDYGMSPAGPVLRQAGEAAQAGAKKAWKFGNKPLGEVGRDIKGVFGRKSPTPSAV